MHHSRHYSSHAEQGEILLRQIYTYIIYVPQAGKEEATETAYEKTWGERTSTTATAIGGRRREHLRQYYECHIKYEQMSLAGKERIAHHSVPVCLGAAVQQQVY